MNAQAEKRFVYKYGLFLICICRTQPCDVRERDAGIGTA